jgi:hypothetical protein
MKQITESQALEILKSRSSSFASVTYRTPQDKLNKGRDTKANPKGSLATALSMDFDAIYKTTTANVLVGTKISYQTLVENRLGKESDLKGVETPDFESAGRTWGNRIDGVEVEHKGERYATFYFVSANIPQVSYDYNGLPIDLDDAKFDEWRKPVKEEGGRQIEAGVDKVIVPRDVNIGNILKISVGGETYEIQH